MMIDRGGDQASYQRVAADLRCRIAGDLYPTGSKLPSESELMQHYEVSRVTVRLAMGALRQEELVVIEQGRGAYVR